MYNDERYLASLLHGRFDFPYNLKDESTDLEYRIIVFQTTKLSNNDLKIYDHLYKI